MATLNEQRKKRARLGFCYTMELNFTSEDSKKSFLSRVESTKQRLTPRGSLPLDSRELLSSLLDIVPSTLLKYNSSEILVLYWLNHN